MSIHSYMTSNEGFKKYTHNTPHVAHQKKDKIYKMQLKTRLYTLCTIFTCFQTFFNVFKIC